MIDFRYHLVSLISVFLALAVGIVLGAGPLRESIGTQLAGQVEQLRTEQDELRAQSEDLASQKDQLSTFITEVGPDLVEDTLPEQDVVVISDDNSTRAAVTHITGLLESSGARTVTHVDLQPSLWDPAAESRRADALQAVAETAPVVLDRSLQDSEQLSALIATLLTEDTPPEFTPALREQVWRVLADHQLVTVDEEAPGPHDAVVYAGADPGTLAVGTDDDATATQRAQQLLVMQTSLLESLATRDVPTVIAAATPANDGTVGILRTVRGDTRFAELSTTDRLQEADGPVLAVLALVEQVRGGSGSYGTTVDADARVPDLPETALLRPEEDGEGTPAPSDAGEG